MNQVLQQSCYWLGPRGLPQPLSSLCVCTQILPWPWQNSALCPCFAFTEIWKPCDGSKSLCFRYYWLQAFIAKQKDNSFCLGSPFLSSSVPPLQRKKDDIHSFTSQVVGSQVHKGHRWWVLGYMFGNSVLHSFCLGAFVTMRAEHCGRQDGKWSTTLVRAGKTQSSSGINDASWFLLLPVPSTWHSFF